MEISFLFSPEIWWFEKSFHSLTNGDGSVSVSLLSHPAVHCGPVRLAGSDGPRHTQAGSQGGTGTSPRPTWTLGEHRVGLMPARTDGGLCPPDRGLFGEKDKRGRPFFIKLCSKFSTKFRLCCLTVAEIRSLINTSYSNSFSAAHYHLLAVIDIFNIPKSYFLPPTTTHNLQNWPLQAVWQHIRQNATKSTTLLIFPFHHWHNGQDVNLLVPFVSVLQCIILGVVCFWVHTCVCLQTICGAASLRWGLHLIGYWRAVRLRSIFIILIIILCAACWRQHLAFYIEN